LVLVTLLTSKQHFLKKQPTVLGFNNKVLATLVHSHHAPHWTNVSLPFGCLSTHRKSVCIILAKSRYIQWRSAAAAPLRHPYQWIMGRCLQLQAKMSSRAFWHI